jgi:hypothetical protein
MSLTRSLIPQQHRPILHQLLVRLSLRQGQPLNLTDHSELFSILLTARIYQLGRYLSDIRSRGAKLFFLAQYSPDLNPVERVFAKLKHLPCKAAARTVEAVCSNRSGAVLTAFIPKE